MYIENHDGLKISALILQLKKPENEQQIKPKERTIRKPVCFLIYENL